MRRAGLLASRREGKHILYRLSDPAVLVLVAALHRVGERNVAEVRGIVGGYFHERDAFEPVSRKELTRRLKGGLVTVLDVRPEDEYAAGYLPQAATYPRASWRGACARSRRTVKLSPIAAAPTASWPSRPSRCCETAALRSGGSRTVIPSGKPSDCPSGRLTPRRLPAGASPA